MLAGASKTPAGVYPLQHSAEPKWKPGAPTAPPDPPRVFTHTGPIPSRCPRNPAYHDSSERIAFGRTRTTNDDRRPPTCQPPSCQPNATSKKERQTGASIICFENIGKILSNAKNLKTYSGENGGPPATSKVGRKSRFSFFDSHGLKVLILLWLSLSAARRLVAANINSPFNVVSGSCLNRPPSMLRGGLAKRCTRDVGPTPNIEGGRFSQLPVTSTDAAYYSQLVCLRHHSDESN